MQPPISGHCAAGFELVRHIFSRNFNAGPGAELGAAFCVYRGNECILDLWGGYRDQACMQPWTADTIVNVWSTTKGAVALCLALLADRGQISYDEPVASYWPEFAAKGKHAITVATVLSHQAGLPAFDEAVSFDDLLDWGHVTSLLAAQAPLSTLEGAVCYHPVTFGFLAGELIRRVSGQDVAQFLTDNLSTPLTADFYIGVPTDWRVAVADVLPPPAAATTETIPPPPVVRALSNPPIAAESANSPEWRNAQLPAANGHASARGIARLYGLVANGGTFEGRDLMSHQAANELSKVRTAANDLLLGIAPRWSVGMMVNPVGIFGPEPSTTGHCGWGGSFGCADPHNHLAMGYTMNRMGSQLYSDPRATTLVDAVYRCL